MNNTSITINEKNFGLISSIIYEYIHQGVEFTLSSNMPLKINRDEQIIDAVVGNQEELNTYLNSLKN